MKISIDDLTTETRSLEEIVESYTIVPKRIGYCSNQISRFEYCGNRITDQDVEAVEVERGKYVCGSCVQSLIAPPLRNLVLERPAKTDDKVRDFQRRPSKLERAL